MQRKGVRINVCLIMWMFDKQMFDTLFLSRADNVTLYRGPDRWHTWKQRIWTWRFSSDDFLNLSFETFDIGRKTWCKRALFVNPVWHFLCYGVTSFRHICSWRFDNIKETKWIKKSRLWHSQKLSLKWNLDEKLLSFFLL